MSFKHLAVAVALLSGCRSSGAKVVADPSPTALDPARLTDVLTQQFERGAAAWNRRSSQRANRFGAGRRRAERTDGWKILHEDSSSDPR